MDKALRLLAKLKNSIVKDEDLARAAWRAAIGERLEAHARFRELHYQTLIVEVDDRVWQGQMHALEKQILDKLQRLLGRRLATRIEYRVAAPRRQPGRAEAWEFQLAPQDAEASRITDPGLRRVYLKSKRKAAG
jgi:dsRNA-specific ribonuclease